jgi:hypothetical protein
MPPHPLSLELTKLLNNSPSTPDVRHRFSCLKASRDITRENDFSLDTKKVERKLLARKVERRHA